ncbi:MAG TPA: hypothetical protein PKE57_01285 [Cellvibrionaceae bacterium]|nr:hypothetical protein [Cellvibrionaceae bacterium]HMW48127.1 hypothetical protein [Cellvibrionaceae bacterium]HMW72604.1 hypothetical protein [Cellvibrionaceae bacterium]HNG59528.1 hypothetical protein [Cellvibrionaceae bacterium]
MSGRTHRIWPAPWRLAQAVCGRVLACCYFLACAWALGAEQAAAQSGQVASAQGLHTAGPDDLPFARLFNTPDQRQSADRRRARQNTPGAAVTPSAPGPAAAGQPMRLSGVMVRADGEQVLWVNGQLQRQSAASPRFKVLGQQRSDSLRVHMAARELKPGQVWRSGSGKAQEAYQVAPPRPAATPGQGDDKKAAEQATHAIDQTASEPLPTTPAHSAPLPAAQERSPER